MEGIATTLEPTVAQPTAASEASDQSSIQLAIERALRNYFANLGDEQPRKLHNMVLAQVEVPLLKMVMRYTNNNQSRAAKILGISRGTLRKKLAIYKIGQVSEG